MISDPMVRLAQTVHLSCVKISTISKQTETSFHLSLWYVSHKPCTYLALSLTPSPNGPKWDLTWPMSLRGSIGCVQNSFQANGTFGANRAPILRQDQHYLQTDWNELPLELRHLGVLLGASKMITEPMVRLAQTVQLSCTDTNTVSKWTETWFDMTHVS
jgi:hypothetical protein